MSKKIIGVTVGSPLPKPNLKQTDPSKGDYVKGKDIIPAKVSQLENDAEYATKEYVQNKIAEAELGGEEVDLSGYAQKSELPTKVSQLQNDAGYLTQHQDLSGYAKTEDIPTTPADIGAQPAGNYALKSEIPSVPVKSVNGKTGAVSLSASDVGADASGTASSTVSGHNTNAAAHSDIRLLIEGLTTRINALANSTDEDLDQMAELVTYIKNNKSLIDGITTSKVNVSDIVNNLTTNVSNKPLSAAQGVALKSLVDGLQSGKLDASSLTTAINTALAQAKASGEFDGVTGQRGTGLLPVTTAPSSYTTAVGGITPKYRMALSTIKTQAGVTEVLLGDTVRYSYYHYPIDYLDASYAYFENRVSIRGATGAAGKDYSFDPTVYGLPVLYLTGDTAPIAVSKDNKVTLSYVYGERSGSCTLKGQGATSYKTAQALVNAGKKGKFNYTIKFDTAFEAKEGWGAQQKYCLKANFIDTTHSRNIVSCILFGMSVKARSTVPSQLANLPNGGAIDGFPIIIMLNDEFHGLYTWNIPKDGWMFGLVEDTTKTQAIVGADDHTVATKFKEASMSGFEVEFVSNEDNADWVNTSLTRLISAVMNSDGSDLDTTVAQYLDWDSAIDHYIHTVVDKATDCVDKNYLLVTFDGVKWYMSAYDRDSIHGLNWDASGTTRPVSNVSFVECAETVRVYELIKRFKTNALKARYKELRGNILSESRIMEKFENFAWAMPSPVMLEDVKLYPTIMGSGVNTIDQIGRFVRQRLARCDEWIDALPAQESTGGSTVTTYAVTNALSNCASSNGATAVNANAAYSATITASDGYTLDGASVTVTMGGTNITSTAYSAGKVSIAKVTGAVVITISAVKKASGYTNLVPTSTDTDGSIYNGTGYKDNARLSSSGGVSSTAQAGSVTTGFMPYSGLGVIRIKGATWEHESGKHYYVNAYDADKTFKRNINAQAVSGGDPAGVSVVYDGATGVTTIDLNGLSSTNATRIDFEAASFIRLTAKGSGSDLIVTVNQEITD